MKNALYALCLLLSTYFIFNIFSGSSSKVVIINPESTSGFFINQPLNISPEIPDKVSFADEELPVERIDVRESLDRELLVNMYWHSQTFLLFKRANRFFPIIEPLLKKNNIHDDFKYLALIESGFMNVKSPAGAAGFWQFLKTTGTKYGLVIDEEVDERYNLEKATEAACKYLHNSYNIFKSWTLAAAAYNMGDAGLGNQIKNQKVYNYYDLFLNSETARYVYRIVAVKIIFENPHKYGFNIEEKDLYPPVNTTIIKIDSTISDLSQFALDNKINLKILKEFNPWLLKLSLTNKSRKIYEIKIPIVEELNYKFHFKN